MNLKNKKVMKVKIEKRDMKKRGRGRPPKQVQVIEFDPTSVKTFRGSDLQDKHKKGGNKNKYYTTFVNIQQMTKAGDFAGSNRLKHMVDAFCNVEKSRDGLERSLFFSKNRDCDKDFKVYFSIYGGGVHYAYETEKAD